MRIYLLFLDDPCEPDPCSNGGTCIQHDDGTHDCICTDGWTGQNCDMSKEWANTFKFNSLTLWRLTVSLMPGVGGGGGVKGISHLDTLFPPKISIPLVLDLTRMLHRRYVTLKWSCSICQSI